MTTIPSLQNKVERQSTRKTRAKQTNNKTSGQHEAQPLETTFAIENPEKANPSQLLFLQKRAGNLAVHQLIQPKLMVGAVDDVFEKQADRIAEQVTANLENETSLQRKPAQPIGEIQLKATIKSPSGVETGQALERRIQGQSGSGSGLPSEVRAAMESEFKTNFSDVKVHTDGQAQALNDSLHARAFTTGKHIYFNRGEYHPESSAGKKLLAHELTHVVQQSNGATPQVQRGVFDWMKKKLTGKAETPVPSPTPRPGLLKGMMAKGVVEETGEALEGDIANLGMGGANLAAGTVSLAGDISGDAATQAVGAGGSMGLSGGQMLFTGMSMAANASKLRRANALNARGTTASRALGKKMKTKASLGLAQQSFGMGSNALGIAGTGLGVGAMVSTGETKDKLGEASSKVSGVGSVLGLAGSMIGSTQGGVSLASSLRRRKASQKFRADLENPDSSKVPLSPEMASIASQVENNQGRGKKGAGLFGSLTSGISSAMNAVSSFGVTDSTTKAILGGVSLGLSALGSAVSGITGLVASMKSKKRIDAAKAKTGTIRPKFDACKKRLDTLKSSRKIQLEQLGQKKQELNNKINESRAESTSPEAKRELTKTTIPELRAEINRKKQAIASFTAEIEVEDVKFRELGRQLQEAEREQLAIDPDFAATKLIEKIKAKDKQAIDFTTEVLGITEPENFIMDEEAAVEVLKGKLNKLAG